MRKLIIILVPLLLVAGGGYASYYFLFRTDDQPRDAAAEAEADRLNAEFVPFGTVNLPVIRHGNIYRYIGLTITLEVAGVEESDLVKQRTSKLNAVFLREGLPECPGCGTTPTTSRPCLKSRPCCAMPPTPSLATAWYARY